MAEAPRRGDRDRSRRSDPGWQHGEPTGRSPGAVHGWRSSSCAHCDTLASTEAKNAHVNSDPQPLPIVSRILREPARWSATCVASVTMTLTLRQLEAPRHAPLSMLTPCSNPELPANLSCVKAAAFEPSGCSTWRLRLELLPALADDGQELSESRFSAQTLQKRIVVRPREMTIRHRRSPRPRCPAQPSTW